MIGFVVVVILALILISGTIGYYAGKQDGFCQGFNNAAQQWANKYNVDMHNKNIKSGTVTSQQLKERRNDYSTWY